MSEEPPTTRQLKQLVSRHARSESFANAPRVVTGLEEFSPRPVTFFSQVDEASARARIKREIEVAESDPKHWLKHQARSRPGFDGWTEPIPEAPQSSALHVPTIGDLERVVSELVTSGAIPGPACPDASCPCVLHRIGRSDDDE